jgi:hypothetical protein
MVHASMKVHPEDMQLDTGMQGWADGASVLIWKGERRCGLKPSILGILFVGAEAPIP